LKGHKIKVLIGVAVSAVTIINAQDKVFKTDAVTGIQYRFIKHNAKGARPKENDVVHAAIMWTGKNTQGDADSVFLDSHKNNKDSLGAFFIPMKVSFRGCLEQGIMMMSDGDSAIFHVNSDSLFHKTFRFPPERPLPPYVKTNPTFTFRIKLLSFQTQEEVMAAKQHEIEKRKKQENIDITEYLQKNNLNVKPDADSIFYLQTTKGNGPQVIEGDSLEVKYTGMYLDGTVFDKSDRGTGKGTLPVFYKKPIPLIKGWISVLGKMNQGDKVMILIPSAMAYGANGYGPIKPFTPLVFEMELVSLKSNK